jgi:hypothetical protein
VKELWNIPLKMYHLLVKGAHELSAPETWRTHSLVQVKIKGMAGCWDGPSEDDEDDFPADDFRDDEGETQGMEEHYQKIYPQGEALILESDEEEFVDYTSQYISEAL